jgi:hypothetical protein
MKLLVEHFFTAFLIGCIGWAASGNPYCIPSALLAGWLTDSDHLWDFSVYSIRAKKINLAFIQSGEYFKANNKIIVPLHAWEISALLFLLGIFIPEHRYLLMTAAIAHGAHLLQDQWTYRVRILGYSLTSRISRRFSYQGFCRPNYD